MREIAEAGKTLAVVLIAGALFAIAFKFGMGSYTEYLEKNRLHEKELRIEAEQEVKRREDARLEEESLRKAQITAQLEFTREQNRLEAAKLNLVHEDLERMHIEIDLKAQAEKTGKVLVELEKEAQKTVEKESALKVSMPTRTFTLKDGTVIRATRWLESGQDWVVKNEAGVLVKIRKDQVEKAE